MSDTLDVVNGNTTDFSLAKNGSNITMTVVNPTVEIANISGTGLDTQLKTLIDNESVNEVGISCDTEIITLTKDMTADDIKNSILNMLTVVSAEDTTLAGLQGKTFTILVDVIDEPTVEYTMTVA